LFVDASGRILAGTASSSIGGSGSIVLQGSAGPGVVRAAFGGTSPGSTDILGAITFTDSSHTGAAYIYGSRDGGTWTSTTSQPSAITFGTTPNGSGTAFERLRITSAGLVGIGTSSPTNTLHVVGSGDSVARISATSDTNLTFSETTANKHWNLKPSAGDFYFQYSGTAYNSGYSNLLTIKSTGNVGIGTTSPSSLLEISSSSTPQFFISNTSNSISAGDNIGTIDYRAGSSNTVVARMAATADSANEDGAHIIFENRTGGGAFSEKVRIDSSGRLLVGTSSAGSNYRAGISSFTPTLQVEGTNVSPLAIQRTDGAPYLYLATGVNVASGSQIGVISFNAKDGTNLVQAATVSVECDGTPGTNDMPGRLVFSTTPDGASSPTERMRIEQSGNIRFMNTGLVFPLTDNAVSLGLSGYRWTEVWAANGTIQTSDQRAKTDITSATLGSDFVKSLRPVSYRWVEGGKVDSGNRDEDGNYIYESVPGTRTHWGFIAQEVKQAVDATGVDFGGWLLTDKDDPDSQQALRYDQFIAPLTKALQETMAELEVLKAEVAALKNQ
jgi:hypothetical protein